MSIDDIINTKENLNRELRTALATMERSDAVQNIHLKIIANQRKCPHFSDKYNWAVIDGVCPYCGFHFSTGGVVK